MRPVGLPIIWLNADDNTLSKAAKDAASLNRDLERDKRTHMRMLTHTRARTHAHARARAHAHRRNCVRTRVCSRVRTCARTHVDPLHIQSVYVGMLAYTYIHVRTPATHAHTAPRIRIFTTIVDVGPMQISLHSMSFSSLRPQFDSDHHQNSRLSSHYSHESVIFL